MLISLQSDMKKLFRLSLIIDLVNDSIGSNECRDSTSVYTRHLFIYLRFYVAFNTVQVISQLVVGVGGGGEQRKPVNTVGQGSVL